MNEKYFNECQVAWDNMSPAEGNLIDRSYEEHRESAIEKIAQMLHCNWKQAEIIGDCLGCSVGIKDKRERDFIFNELQLNDMEFASLINKKVFELEYINQY